MARTGDIIAAVDDDTLGALCMLAALGQGIEVLSPTSLKEALSWVSSEAVSALVRQAAAENVSYKRIPVIPKIVSPVTRFLGETQMRSELQYPFAFLAAGSALLISAIDFESVMEITRSGLNMGESLHTAEAAESSFPHPVNARQ